MMSRSASLRRPTHRLRIVLHFQRRLLRIVDHPEEHGVDVYRNRIGRQRLFSRKARRDHSLVHPR